MNNKQKYFFKKLVRDKIPDLFKKQNIQVNFKKLNEDEHIKELKIKLVEEAKEVGQTTNLEECVEEITDLLDVIKTLKNLLKISDQDISKKSNLKKKSRGGFEDGYYIDYININTNHPLTKYFEKNIERYPKVEKNNQDLKNSKN